MSNTSSLLIMIGLNQGQINQLAHILVSVIERVSKQPWGFPRESTTGTMVISNSLNLNPTHIGLHHYYNHGSINDCHYNLCCHKLEGFLGR